MKANARVYVPVSGLFVQSSLQVGQGQSVQIPHSILPSNATNKGIIWTSDKPSEATVDSNGVVTGIITPGSANITATTVEGGFSATCAVTVVDLSVTGLSVALTSTNRALNSASGITLGIINGVGETTNVTGTISPSNAANPAINWTSSDPTVATVSATGSSVTITALSKGSATITSTPVDTTNSVTQTFNVDVQDWLAAAIQPTGDSSYKGLVIAMDPFNNAPAVAYVASGAIQVWRWNGSSYVQYGGGTVPGSVVPNNSGINIALTFDTSGNAYVGFPDSTQSNRLVVMRSNGASWITAGGAPVSSGTATYISLAYSNSGGNVYASYIDSTASSSVTVMKLAGSWISGIGSPGFSSPSSFYTSLVYAPSVDFAGTNGIYAAYTDGAGSQLRVGYDISGVATTTGGLSPSAAAYESLTTNPNQDTLYVGFNDTANFNLPTVYYRVNGSGPTWTNLGNAGFGAGVATQLTMTVNSLFSTEDVPYVLYADNSNGLKIMLYKYSDGVWKNLSGPFTSLSSPGVGITSRSGIVYAAIENGANVEMYTLTP